MKELATFGLLILILFTPASAQWQRLISSDKVNLTGVAFINADSGFAAGGSVILRTSNGGNEWDLTELTNGVRGICYPSPNIAYAVGQAVYKSTDGGQRWDSIYTQQRSPGLESRAVFFTDRERGVVAGISPTEYTIDGGKSWNFGESEVGVSLCQAISFVTRDTGFMGGFVSGATGYAGTAFRTVDGGANWQSITSRGDKPVRIGIVRSIYFRTPSLGWIAGQSTGNDPDAIRLQVTRDGGETWDTINTRFANTVNKIIFANAMVGFIADDNGFIYVTSDGGENWTDDGAPSRGNSINDMFIVDGATVYAVGDEGTILKRTITTSVDENIPDRVLTVFPNPSSGTFRILVGRDVPVTLHHLVVNDELGIEILRISTSSSQIALDLSGFAPGVYYVRIQTGTNTRMAKLALH